MGKYKNSISFEEGFCEIFNTEEDLKDYLTFAFEEYLQDGDFNVFCRSLELVIKSRDTINGFAKKVDLSKMGLYNIINGKKEPKIRTLAKILKELGCTLKIA
jgi:probable addiction module antidote protein